MKRENQLSFNANRRKFIQYTGALIGGMALPMGAVASTPIKGQ